jgi:AraC-like DNA-binding protein
VAAHLWYSQVTNFARDFKRCHGVPPAEIQDALAQNVAF